MLKLTCHEYLCQNSPVANIFQKSPVMNIYVRIHLSQIFKLELTYHKHLS